MADEEKSVRMQRYQFNVDLPEGLELDDDMYKLIEAEFQNKVIDILSGSQGGVFLKTVGKAKVEEVQPKSKIVAKVKN